MSEDEKPEIMRYLAFSAGSELSGDELGLALETARELSNEYGARVMLGMSLLRSVAHTLDRHTERPERIYEMRMAMAGLEFDFLEEIGMKCKLPREEWIALMVDEELTKAEADLLDEIERFEKEEAQELDILNAEVIIDGGEQ